MKTPRFIAFFDGHEWALVGLVVGILMIAGHVIEWCGWWQDSVGMRQGFMVATLLLAGPAVFYACIRSSRRS